MLTAVVVLAAIGIGAALVVGRSERGSNSRVVGGPLACRDCGYTGSSIPVPRHRRASFGIVRLRNTGPEPAVLERVELLEAEPRIELEHALVVEPSRDTPSIGILPGFPRAGSRGRVSPVAGYVVEPARDSKRSVQLLLRLRLTTFGSAAFRRVAVDYRVGTRRYRAVFNDRVRVCASRRERFPPCDIPVLWPDDTESPSP